MKKAVLLLFVFFALPALWAQNRYALVIGNNDYVNIQRLANPVNDATDIAAKLRTLGYQVDLQTNLTNVAMARTINDFVNRLARNRSNEGFFWFAGHGVQIGGENYMLPIDVVSTNEVEARHSSFQVRRLIELLDQVARNKVNIVVLDACRDNPFPNIPGAFRNITRGLGVIQNLPPDLLVIFSTEPGTVAADGTGQRNSPFTQAFLQNMDSHDDIQMVFRAIAQETMRLTNNVQRPFQEGSFMNLLFYSLNPRREQPGLPPVAPPQAAPVPVAAIAPAAMPSVPPPPIPRHHSPNFVRVAGGTFQMGCASGEWTRPVRNVTVSSFYMSSYPVTQGEWEELMGSSPSRFRGDNRPVEQVSWFDAIEFANAKSRRSGLTPAYTISGSGDNRTVSWNRGANGYRLPTEAEWEFAARGGIVCRGNFRYSGSNAVGEVAWHNTNSAGSTQDVGLLRPNALGLYDMSGNVWEWVWDWLDRYPSAAQTNPVGASSGSFRVLRGGSWINSAAYVHSVLREGVAPSDRVDLLGFRLVRP